MRALKLSGREHKKNINFRLTSVPEKYLFLSSLITQRVTNEVNYEQIIGTAQPFLPASSAGNFGFGTVLIQTSNFYVPNLKITYFTSSLHFALKPLTFVFSFKVLANYV